MSDPKPAGIFRQAAIERLSSPERLDVLSDVITPKSLLALATLLACAAGAVAWGFLGSIPTKVRAPCMITRAGGVLEVSAGSGGRIAEFRVQVGDRVQAGDVIARIEQPELVRQIAAGERKLTDLHARRESIASFARLGDTLQAELTREQEADLRNRIANGESRLAAVGERLESQKALLQQGLITQQQLLETRIEHDTVRQEIDSARSQIKELAVRRLEGRKQREAELATLRLEIAEADSQLAAQRESLSLRSLVRSPYSGRVLELRGGGVGVLVDVGATLMTLEPDAASGPGALEVVIFAPPGEGKNIRPGMEVQVSPANVRREESGFLLAKVRWVADYPSSQQGIMRVLQNERLADQLSAGGAPIQVLADLSPDPAAPDGYRWSSGRGPQHGVDSGTLCDAGVTLERRRPATLVLPLLKKTLGVD